EPRRDRAARGVDVHLDLLVRIVRGQEDQLRHDEVGERVGDRPADHDDPVAQQPGVDVERALTVAALVLHDGRDPGHRLPRLQDSERPAWDREGIRRSPDYPGPVRAYSGRAIAPQHLVLAPPAARSLFPLTQRWVFMNHAGVAPMSERGRAAIEALM